MRGSRQCLSGTVMVALLIGPGGTVSAQDEDPTADPMDRCGRSDTTSFPTGIFERIDGFNYLAFDEYGAWANNLGDRGTYTIEGDLYTETTHDWRSLTPATYRWDWDGERLTFEVIKGSVEDEYPGRTRFYTDQPWVRTTGHTE